MSENAVLLEEDGFYEITLKSKDGTSVTKTIDLYDTHNALVLIQRANPDDAIALHTEIRKYMQEKLEFPDCSARMADRFMRTIFDSVAALQKKSGDEERPELPDSTESAPGVAVP